MASVANPFDVLETGESRQSRRRKARRGASKDGQVSAGVRSSSGGARTASGRAAGGDTSEPLARGGGGGQGGTSAGSHGASSSSPSPSGSASPYQHGGPRGNGKTSGRNESLAHAGSGSGSNQQVGGGYASVADEDNERWEVVRESSGKGLSKQTGGGSGGSAGESSGGSSAPSLSDAPGGGGGGGGVAIERSRVDLQLPSAMAEIEVIENIARACAEDEDSRARLWREWAKRAAAAVADRATGGGKDAAVTPTTYALTDPTAEGNAVTSVTWKEVFLLSRGLEISIEKCFSSPLKHEHQRELEALLCAVLPSSCEPQALAGLLTDFGALIGSESVKIINSAKLAFMATVTALKGTVGSKERLGSNSNAQRLEALNAEMTENELRLRQLAERSDQVSTLSERTRCSGDRVRLSKAKLDLLLASKSSEPSREAGRQVSASDRQAPQASPSQILSCIESLAEAVTEKGLEDSSKLQQQQHQQQHQQQQQQQAATKKGDAARGRVQAQVAELRQEMADLGNEAAALARKIREAEETLETMRSEYANVESRRSVVQERYRQAVASGASATRVAATAAAAGSSASTTPGTQVSASLQKNRAQLNAVLALKNYVLRTQKAWQPSLPLQKGLADQSLDGAVVGFLEAFLAHLRNKQHQQQEVKQRLRFCLEKMVPLETEMHQLVQLKKNMLANELVKPLGALQKIQKQWLAEEESIMRDVNSTAAAALQNPDIIMLSSRGPSASVQSTHEGLLQRLTSTVHQMRNEHELIMGAMSVEISVSPIGAHLPYGYARGVQSTEALSALLSFTPGMEAHSTVT